MNAPDPKPLDAEQLRVLGETRALGKKLRRARIVAVCNVVSLAVLGALSLLFDLFSLSFSLIGVALLALAYNEERGRRRLIALDPRAANQLALNQLALFAVVLVYCAYGAYGTVNGFDALRALTNEPGELGELSRQLNSGGIDFVSWVRTLSLVVYGAVAFGSLLVQGLTALYYRSLRPSIEELARAPEWTRALD